MRYRYRVVGNFSANYFEGSWDECMDFVERCEREDEQYYGRLDDCEEYGITPIYEEE